MKKNAIINILLLIGVVCLFPMCNDKTTHADYDINHYIDTIDSHVILVTVCGSKSSNHLSVSTLELK